VSPTEFRTFETEIRGGRNLSMPSARPSIPPLPSRGENSSKPSGEPRESGS
jgi:hypothetical protein